MHHAQNPGIIMVHMSGAPGMLRPSKRSPANQNSSSWRIARSATAGSVKGQKVGTFGDMGIFSFQMNKNMSSGEGGCRGDEQFPALSAGVRLPRFGLCA